MAAIAGKWDQIKDTAGKEKKGVCMNIYAMGPCAVSACSATPRRPRPSTPQESTFSAACPFSLPAGAVRMSRAVHRLRHHG